MTERFQQKVVDMPLNAPPDNNPKAKDPEDEKVTCKKCGKQVKPDAKGNCPECGAALKSIDPNVGGGTDRDKMDAADFAGKDRSFPIKTPGDVSDAASSIGRAGSDNYPPEKIKANIIRIAHRKGPAFVDALPDSWKEDGGKSLDLSYAKSLGLTLSDDELRDLLAVKRVGVDKIFHYVYLWGNPQVADLEHEYFTKSTNFWDERLGKGFMRPMTWDHAMDPSMKADPIIGTTLEFGDDEIGRWAISQLDRAHQYRKAVDALLEARVVGTSSDSAPQYVERVQNGKSFWLKTWPWFASALTVTPCEHRMVGTVEYYKSIGITLPNPEASGSQTRAMVSKAHRIFSSMKMYTGE